MDPHSSDFIEHDYEPRNRPGGNGLRRLALLLPLVAAVPISFAVLSQRSAERDDPNSIQPPANLTPTAGLIEEKKAPKTKPIAKPAPDGAEIVEPAELARLLDKGEEKAKGDKTKPEESKGKAEDKTLQAKADSAIKSDKKPEPADPKKVAEVAKPEPKKEAAKPKPEPQPKPTPAPPKRPSSHIVKNGDTLYNLGQRYGIPAEAIARENRIGVNDTIHRDQKLNIPTVAESKKIMAAKPQPKSQTPPPGPVPYPLTPVSGGQAQAKPQPRPALPVQNNRSVQTQPTNQRPANVATVTPAIGVPARNRTSKPRTNTGPVSPPAAASPNTHIWAHANGTFVPANQPPSTPTNPAGTLRPVSGGIVHSTRSISYRVQASDTLPSIAAGHSTTVGVLTSVNNNIRNISQGQIIVVPVDGILIPTPRK